MALNAAAFLQALQPAQGDQFGDMIKLNNDRANAASTRATQASTRNLQGAQTQKLNQENKTASELELAKAAALSGASVWSELEDFYTPQGTDNPNDKVNAFDKTLEIADSRIRVAEAEARIAGKTPEEVAQTAPLWRDTKKKIEASRQARGTPQEQQAAQDVVTHMRALRQAKKSAQDLELPGFKRNLEKLGKSDTLVDSDTGQTIASGAEAGLGTTGGQILKAFRPRMITDQESGENFLGIPTIMKDGSTSFERVPIEEGYQLAEFSDGQKIQSKMDLIKERADSARRESIAKGDGERITKVLVGREIATDQLIELNRLRWLADKINSGGWSNQIAAEVRRVTGTSPANEQEAISMFQRRALRSLRFFPGQISEGERKFAVAMEANFGKVNAANIALLDFAIEENKRDIAKAGVVQKARAQGPEAMLAALDQFEQNASQAAVGGAGTQLGTSGPEIGLTPKNTPDQATGGQTSPTGVLSGQEIPDIDKNLRLLSNEELEAALRNVEGGQ